MDYHQSATGLIGALLGATVSLSPTGSADTWNASLWSGLSVNQAPGGGNWNGWAWNDVGWTGSAWAGAAWNGSAWDSSGWN